MIGRSVRRKEDLRFLIGQGRFVDDVHIDGTLHLGVVRSPHAHAKVIKIDWSRVRAIPGVVATIVNGDYAELSNAIPELMEPGSLNNPYCDFNAPPPQFPLPHDDIVRFQGEPVAVLLAESAYTASDAVEAVQVEYEAQPAVVDLMQAVTGDSPQVHREHPNIVAHLSVSIGDVERAFREADIVFSERLSVQSLSPVPIEGRGILAHWDAGTGTLMIWSTNQTPYSLRDTVARILRLPYEKVRVISRDIGGGFGPKGPMYPEDIIVSVLAYRLRRPVKWIETRYEHLLATAHSGEQIHDVRVAASQSGKLLGLDIKLYKDVGAYNHFEMVVPTNTINHLPTHYKIPNLTAEAWCVVTNKVFSCPYRGAGRPEATFVMDRVLDRLASEVKQDPLDVRMLNIIPAEEMPYRTGLTYRDSVPIVYDGGNYPLMLNRAVELADYHGWRRRQAESGRDRAVGIGLSSYLEAGGIGPSEGATVRVEDTGHVTVFVGVNSHGQGHETTFAQICAHFLDANFDDVSVLGGDTSLMSYGFGTGASRVAVNTGNAIAMATQEVRKKIIRVAAHVLECSESDVVIADSRATVTGSPTRAFSFGELATFSMRSSFMSGLGGPGLNATAFYYPETVTWSGGVHIAVVELDRETGLITILKYVVVHDSGIQLNPMIVDGQVHGGLLQGLGAALSEEVTYGEAGQVLSGSLMEYAIPRATDAAPLELESMCFPTQRNPLGIRAVGESGPISPPAAIAAAVEDALGGDVRLTTLPVTPFRIFTANRASENR